MQMLPLRERGVTSSKHHVWNIALFPGTFNDFCKDFTVCISATSILRTHYLWNSCWGVSESLLGSSQRGWIIPLSLQAWGAARKVSKDDWLEWLRRLSVVLLKESSSPALRSCWSLAQTYIPLARYTCHHLPTSWPHFTNHFTHVPVSCAECQKMKCSALYFNG